MPRQKHRQVGLTFLLVMTAACQAAPSGPVDARTPNPPGADEVTAAPRPTSTAVRTPPTLPGPFQSRYLDPLDSVHTYMDDTCAYLRNRWNPSKSAPGTVVMIIMIHSIIRSKVGGPEALTSQLHTRMMEDLHEQRFHAINMQQLADFLEDNARIPYRSVVLIQDQNRYPENFNTHFRRYWETWGWPVVNAWDQQGSISEPLWEAYEALSEEGLVDFQVFGPTFDPATRSLTDEYLTAQLQKPIEVFQERFDKRPVGVIWPNGFSAQSVRIARKLGYRLGFTFNSRGPVMYNWVPLSDAIDNLRPSFRPESPVGDPLMTLPRFRPQEVHAALDSVRISGEKAAAYAEEHKGTELEYYDIMCAAEYGSIPAE